MVDVVNSTPSKADTVKVVDTKPSSFTDEQKALHDANGHLGVDGYIDKAWARLFNAGLHVGPAMDEPTVNEITGKETQHFLYAFAVRDLSSVNVNFESSFFDVRGFLAKESGL